MVIFSLPGKWQNLFVSGDDKLHSICQADNVWKCKKLMRCADVVRSWRGRASDKCLDENLIVAASETERWEWDCIIRKLVSLCVSFSHQKPFLLHTPSFFVSLLLLSWRWRWAYLVVDGAVNITFRDGGVGGRGSRSLFAKTFDEQCNGLVNSHYTCEYSSSSPPDCSFSASFGRFLYSYRYIINEEWHLVCKVFMNDHPAFFISGHVCNKSKWTLMCKR